MGPRYGEGNEDEKLKNATLNALQRADGKKISSVAQTNAGAQGTVDGHNSIVEYVMASQTHKVRHATPLVFVTQTQVSHGVDLGNGHSNKDIGIAQEHSG